MGKKVELLGVCNHPSPNPTRACPFQEETFEEQFISQIDIFRIMFTATTKQVPLGVSIPRRGVNTITLYVFKPGSATS